MSATGIAGNQTIVLGACGGRCAGAEGWTLAGYDPLVLASRRDAFADALAVFLRQRGEDWLREQRGRFSCGCLGLVVDLDGDTLVHLAWESQDRSAARISGVAGAG